MKRYIGYYRVSTKGQSQSGLGLEAQRQRVEAFCAAHSGTICAEYVDTQSGKDDDRPQLLGALRSAKELRATLVVAKLDRLARSARFLDDIVCSGVEVVFCDLPEIPPGPTGRLIVQVMASIAEWEAGIISERTKAALRQARERGTKLGGYRGTAPTNEAREASRVARRNYADKKARELVPVLTEIQQAGAKTYDAMALELNRRGVSTTTGKGRWHAMTVRNLIARLHDMESRTMIDAQQRAASYTGWINPVENQREDAL